MTEKNNRDSEALFEEMGKVYKLLVDEEKRAKNEAPLLLELAEAAEAETQSPVLDLACGTGFHSRLLAREGHPVLGIDYGESMLEEARSQSEIKGIHYRRGNLLEPLPVDNPVSLALLLGNTLSTFETPRQRKEVFENIASVLLPGGHLLCQILNYERLARKKTITTTRHGYVSGRESLLSKVLQLTDEGRFLIAMHACQKDDTGQWHSASRTTLLAHLDPAEIRKEAEAAGLHVQAEWGDYQKSPYDPAKSPDYLILLQKK